MTAYLTDQPHLQPTTMRRNIETALAKLAAELDG